MIDHDMAILNGGGKLAAIEVKWSHRIDESDIASLKKSAEDLKDKLLFSVIIYSGTKIVPIAPPKWSPFHSRSSLELRCRHPSKVYHGSPSSVDYHSI